MAKITAVKTTTMEATTTEPVDRFVEPPAEDFEYTYDAVLKGVKIVRYNGGARTVRIRAPVVQIGCNTKYDILNGNQIIEIFSKSIDKIKDIVYNKKDKSGPLLSLVWLTL